MIVSAPGTDGEAISVDKESEEALEILIAEPNCFSFCCLDGAFPAKSQSGASQRTTGSHNMLKSIIAERGFFYLRCSCSSLKFISM